MKLYQMGGTQKDGRTAGHHQTSKWENLPLRARLQSQPAYHITWGLYEVVCFLLDRRERCRNILSLLKVSQRGSGRNDLVPDAFSIGLGEVLLKQWDAIARLPIQPVLPPHLHFSVRGSRINSAKSPDGTGYFPENAWSCGHDESGLWIGFNQSSASWIGSLLKSLTLQNDSTTCSDSENTTAWSIQSQR